MAVTDDAILKIKARVQAGQLRPGDRLAREADLAADLGVSRNSLREAVRALSFMGVLEVRHGDGTFVSSLEPAVLMESLGFLVDFHQDSSILDFVSLRRILEPAATAIAARELQDAEIERIRAVIAGDTLTTSITDLIDHDLKFHSMIAAGARNPVLASILDSIAMPTARARLWRGIVEEDALERTLAEHAGILDALQAHDSELAAARALQHISGVEEWLRRELATDGLPPEAMLPGDEGGILLGFGQSPEDVPRSSVRESQSSATGGQS